MSTIWCDPRVNDELGSSRNGTTRVELQRRLFVRAACLRRKRRIIGSGMNALAAIEAEHILYPQAMQLLPANSVSRSGES
jgi:hypothetical protein